MKRIRSLIFAALPAVLLSACGGTSNSDALVSDPLEGLNRGTHIFNKTVDRAVLRPASQAYGVVAPDLFKMMFGNAVSHLSLPGV
ncbi:MAG: MlaA family lipoprotein, partial [Pseudomonadota bacterium]